MMGSEPSGSRSGAPEESGEEMEHSAEETGFLAKLVLTAFPFLLVLLFLVLEWWVRGRS